MAVNKSRIRLYAALLVCNLIVFSLSAHVNAFTGFFYVADLFPFVGSILTFAVVGATLLNDLRRSNSNPVLSRPMFELPLLGTSALIWLCMNAFSSSRWKNVQAADCGSIPTDGDLNSVTVWCKEIQALRSFVWVEWIIVIGTLLWLSLQTSREAARGNRHVWSTSFARPAKTSLAHLSFDNVGRRSVGALSTGAASSFHTGEEASRYSTQSQAQQFPNDFEKESAEHYNNTHNAYVPRHKVNNSGSSGYTQNQAYQQDYPAAGQQYSGQQIPTAGQQSYNYDPSYDYGNNQYTQPQQQQPSYGYGYGYQQQQPTAQIPAQQQQQGPGYFFDGYGQAR